MRHPSALAEDQILRVGALLTGVTFLASSALAAELARGHIAALQTICGASNAPHCGWCFGAASLALAGFAALAYAAKPAPRLSRIRLGRIGAARLAAR